MNRIEKLTDIKLTRWQIKILQDICPHPETKRRWFREPVCVICGFKKPTKTEFFRKNPTARVQLYVELRDMYIGPYVAENALYLVVFGVVLRIRRGVDA